MANQLLYLEPGDGIIEACEKLTRLTETEVSVIIPRRGLLLQNLINLKILKRLAENSGKTVIIGTQDPIGRKFADEAGFRIMEDTPAEETPKVAISHYETYRTAPDLDAPLVESIEESELTEETDDMDLEEAEIPADVPTRKLRILSRPNFKLGMPTVRMPKLTLPRLERHHRIILSIVLVGLLLLGSVSYFVVPKAYATIEVPSDPFKKQFSLALVDGEDRYAVGANLLPGRFIEVTRESVSTFNATGSENNGTKAEGKITVLNYTKGIQGLLANTRFQATNGLVLRLKNEVLVPPSNGSNPGRAVADAIADEGGAKYNVSAPLKLTVPGLGTAGNSLVVGEVNGTFTGGTDQITKIVSQGDIDKAKEEGAKNVFTSAETELQGQVHRGEELMPNFIQNDVIDSLPSVSAGSKKDQFEVRVQSRSWTLVLPKGKLREAVANAAVNEAPEGKQVSDHTIEQAKIDIAEGNFLTRKINLVVSLDGRVGPRLDSQAIVKSITNKSRAAAEQILKGQPNITSASLEIWPRLIPRVPLLPNNIKLRVIYIGE